MEHRLANGDLVVVRPVRASDKPGLSRGLTRLSPDSVHRRFFSPKSGFSGSELRYLTEVDGRDHVALVAVLAAEPGTIVASGRWVRDPDDRAVAEMAIVVADGVQGQGLGTILGRALADAARDRGVTRFTAVMLADNEAALRLFRSISEHLDHRVRGGVRELVAVLEEDAIAP